jgi:hypothetical protein
MRRQHHQSLLCLGMDTRFARRFNRGDTDNDAERTLYLKINFDREIGPAGGDLAGGQISRRLGIQLATIDDRGRQDLDAPIFQVARLAFQRTVTLDLEPQVI